MIWVGRVTKKTLRKAIIMLYIALLICYNTIINFDGETIS
tara:strand:+ start:597 stop:716 length:120 start_codon:yes stop_codon:yes gene_type:complete